MRKTVLFDDGKTQWITFGRDPSKPDTVIDTNEYLVVSGDEAILLDPGGTEIFPAVLTAVSEVIEIRKIRSYLASHQDPDILSSLPLWMNLTPEAKVYLSWLWEGFIAHFGNEFAGNFVKVPDEGMTITVGGSRMQLIPAHYCHSSGNFNLYDPSSKILFSGDVGSALLPVEAPQFVEDFQSHVQFMDKFHRRWMPSNEAKNRWVARIRKLDVKMMCPQHGAIFRGDDVGRFLDWFEDLEVGQASGGR